MILIGTAGRAGAGKDTVGDYLVRAHGFVKFSFSDALYDEVQRAYRLDDQETLRDRDLKERAVFRLAPFECDDRAFQALLLDYLHSKRPRLPVKELRYYAVSPREVLQLWGTEYRRAQDPDYWIERAGLFLKQKFAAGHGRFVNTAVRFANECEFVDRTGGTVWHVLRKDLPEMTNAEHSSEKPLPIRFGDQVIFNDGGMQVLERRVDAAMDVLLAKAA